MDPAKVKALIDALTANPPDPDAIKAAATDMLAALAGAGDAPDALSNTPSTPPPDPSAPGPDPKLPPPGTASALAKQFGVKSDAEIVTLFRGMQTQIEALSTERDTADLEARRDVIAELVKIGVETPATAWLGDAKDRKPVKRLASEPIADMKARLEVLRASRPAQRGHEPPEGADTDLDAEVAKLSKVEIAACKKRGMDLKEYVVAKAAAVRRI